MQKFLKTAALATAMALIGTAVFAADSFTAKLKFDGNILSDSGMVFNNTGQKDYDDTLHFTYSGDSAGAHFRFAFAKMDDYENAVNLNSASIWFAPMAGLKFTVGQIEAFRFKEQIEHWRAPVQNWEGAGDWVGADDGNGGMSIDFTGVENLGIYAFLEPGWGNNVLDFAGDGADPYNANTDYGIIVSYNVAGFGKVVGSFQDEGDASAKQITVGTDVTAVAGLYAFENIGIAFDGDFGYSHVAFDTYLKYTGVENLTIHGWFPVTVVTDDVRMKIDVKIEYNLSGTTVYGRFFNWSNLNDFTFEPQIRIGAVKNIDLANLEAWLQLDVPASGDIGWSIPFTVKLNW